MFEDATLSKWKFEAKVWKWKFEVKVWIFANATLCIVKVKVWGKSVKAKVWKWKCECLQMPPSVSELPGQIIGSVNAKVWKQVKV